MRKKCQVFLSYARVDNESVTGDGLGWVSQFRTAMMKDAARPNWLLEVLFDKSDIQNALNFRPQLDNFQSSSQALVVMLSENWLASTECQKELASFIGETAGGTPRGIFVVAKGYVKEQVFIDKFDGLTPFNFFVPRDDANPEDWLEMAVTNHPESRFRNELRKLTNQMRRYLMAEPDEEQVTPETNVPATAALPCPGRVLLTRPSRDLLMEGDKFYDELVGRNFDVVELQEYRGSAVTVTKELNAVLPGVDATIHLVGAQPAYFAGTNDLTLDKLQFDLAGQHENTRRLVWGRDVSLSSVLGDLNLTTDDRIFSGAWEETKTDILDALVQKKHPDRGRDFYLVYGKEDVDDVVPIIRALKKSAISYLPSMLEGESHQLTQDHIEKLETARGVLIYWGRASDSWFIQKVNDLRKYLPPAAQVVRVSCIGAPTHSQKEIVLEFVRDDFQQLCELHSGDKGEQIDALVQTLQASL